MKALYFRLFCLSATILNAQRPGTLDPSFGRNGQERDTVGPRTNYSAMIVQPDGKILIGGSGRIKGTGIRTFRIDRLNRNGAPDKTFGNKGTVLIPFHFSNNEENHPAEVTALGLQSDGKIIAAGPYQKGRDYAGIITLVRLLPDGKIDSSFGDSGIAQTKTKGGTSLPNAMQIQTDNKIVLGGYYSFGSGGSQVYFLERLQANGRLDTAFADGGQIYDSLGAVNALAIQPDGKIIAGGVKYDSVYHNFFLMRRYLSTGALDSSFANNGTLDTAISPYSYATDIALQQDGKIVASGGSQSLRGGSPYFTLARFTADGKTDQSFAKKGVMVESLHISYCRRLLLTRGHILMAGMDLQTGRGSNSTDCIVHAYTGNGIADTTFANKGEIRIIYDYFNSLADAALQADGKLLLLDVSGNNYDGYGPTYEVRHPLRYYGYSDSSSGLAEKRALRVATALSPLTISPNPATEYVVVNGLPAHDKVTLVLTDALGKELAFYNLNHASQCRLDISRWKAGMYYLQINANGKTEVRRFVKE